MHQQHVLRTDGLIWVLSGLLAVWTQGSIVHAAPPPASDHSLTIQKYHEAGVPPIDRPWLAEDFQKAARALETIARQDPTQLPRYESKTSGELFAHMISPKNLDVFTDPALPVDDRMKRVMEIPAYLPVFILYASSVTPSHTFDVEMLEIGGFMLRAKLAAATVLGEYVAAHTIKKDDAAAPAALSQMHDSIAQTASGVIELMMDRSSVRASVAARFARELKDILAKLAIELPPGAQAGLKGQLKQAAGREENRELRGALDELAGILK